MNSIKIFVAALFALFISLPAGRADAFECVTLKLKKTRLRADDWSGEVALGERVSRKDAETVARAIKRNQLVYRVTPDAFHVPPDLTALRFVSVPAAIDSPAPERGVRYLEFDMPSKDGRCAGVRYLMAVRGSTVELLRITPWLG